jgi:archaemetzincin
MHVQVVSHEVCHLFRLVHCEFFHCAMNESTTMSEAMSQPLFLCPVCLRKLHHSCGFDVVERYEEMKVFLTQVQQQYPSQFIHAAILWLQECLTFLKQQ